MTKWYVEETVVNKWYGIEADTWEDAIVIASQNYYGPDDFETMDWSAEPEVEEM